MPADRTYITTVRHDDASRLILDIQALEMRATALGLHPAARALNNAKNAVGWQTAGDIVKANEAATYCARGD